MVPHLTPLVLLAFASQLAHAFPAESDSVNGGWDQLHLVNKRWQLYTTVAEPGTTTDAAAAAAATASSAYSYALLTAPAVPEGVATTATFRLYESADALVDPARGASQLSVQQQGNFLGYSIELSVANQVCAFLLPMSFPPALPTSPSSSQEANPLYCPAACLLQWDPVRSSFEHPSSTTYRTCALGPSRVLVCASVVTRRKGPSCSPSTGCLTVVLEGM